MTKSTIKSIFIGVISAAIFTGLRTVFVYFYSFQMNKDTKVKLGNVTFELTEVVHDGSSLKLWVTGFNEGASLKAGISHGASAIDSMGNYHKNPGRRGDRGWGSGDYTWVSLPNEVTSRFALSFKSISPNEKKLQQVSIPLKGVGTLIFKDVPIP